MTTIRDKNFYIKLRKEIEGGLAAQTSVYADNNKAILKVSHGIGEHIYLAAKRNKVAVEQICNALSRDTKATARNLRRYHDFYNNWNSFREFIKHCDSINRNPTLRLGCGDDPEKKPKKEPKLPTITIDQFKELASWVLDRVVDDEDRKAVQSYKGYLIRAIEDPLIIRNLRNNNLRDD